jgi:hypothetical protein
MRELQVGWGVQLGVIRSESPDWFEWVQIALVRMALEQLSPEEERAVWLYAEGARLPKRERQLAETAIAKVRRMLALE